MHSRTSNSGAQRRASLDAVLSYAWRTAIFTASDAMAVVELTRSTTIDAIDELVDRGFVRELPNARAVGDYQKGRPSRRFELRADVAVVVGVDMAADHILAMVADLRGNTLSRHDVVLDAENVRADERRAAAESAVERALQAAGKTRRDVLALCAGVAAPVDARGESPPHPTGFWRRMNPNVAGQFATWVPIVRVENDASLAAIAEGSIGAAAGTGNFVTLLSGEYLGAGVVVDGNLLRGAHGGVAEMVAFDHVIGVHGAGGLEPRIAQFARDARASGSISSSSPLAALAETLADGKQILRLARAGDEDAERVVARTGRLLAVVAGVMASLFDPSRVVLSGMAAEDVAQLVEAARASLPLELDLPAPRLEASPLGVDVVCRGAVAAALEAARTGILDLGDGWRSPAPDRARASEAADLPADAETSALA